MRPAWSECVMTCFCCITGTTIFYSVPEHVFESPWLCDVNHGNRYSSFGIFRLHLFTLINSFSGHKLVQCPGKAKIEQMEEYSEAKT